MFFRSVLLFVVFVLVSVSNLTAQSGQSSPALRDGVDSLSYSLGINLARNLKTSGITQINSEVLSLAVSEALRSQSVQLTQAEATRYIDEYVRTLQKERNEANRRAGLRFLEENRTREGVVVRSSGLQYKVIRQGTGPRPTISDQVAVHYHGTLVDGTVFDSTIERGVPLQCYVNDVIMGWVEALLLMNVGSKWMLYIPSDLAYGSSPRVGTVEPNSTLIFEIELLEII